MKSWYLLFTFILFTALGFSQNDSRLVQDISPITAVEKVSLPLLDNEELLQNEMERRGPGLAPRFAESIEVNISPKTHGNWERCKNGNLVWRLVVQSSTAKSINLGFTKYNMPDQGSLILYSSDYKHILGPFTPADNEEHQQLWTPIIPGDELVLEVQLPEKSKSELELELKYINHDFIGFGAMVSGNCNIDVICGALDGWDQIDDYRDVIRSVAIIGSQGNIYCTGFLVNNARNDCTPFFMTAKHCGFSAANAPTLVAYWNYENSYCREVGSMDNENEGDGALNDFNTGAIYRSGSSASDFTLLELDDPVSETTNAYFAGWSNLPVAPTKAVGIHHPNGEEKRISFDNDELMLTNGLEPNADPNFTHVRVIDWDYGTTEQGSSGSPLFDQNKHVVGQLHGGAAACGNDKSDWYGSFAVSWEGGGTTTTNLKEWLDPDNTGITTLDGREISTCSIFVESYPSSVELCAPSNAVFQIFASEIFSANVNLSVSTNIPGVEILTLENDTLAPGDSTQLYLTVYPDVSIGDYSIFISGTDGTVVGSDYIDVTIFETAPDPLEQMTPANEEISTSIIPRFSWQADAPEATYELQIASDTNFTNIIATVSELDTSFYDNFTLEVLTKYFWRVRGTNLCGNGAWSETFSFTTADVHCYSNSSIDVPILLPEEDTSLIISTIEILDNGLVTDVDVVNLDIHHTWVGDLVVSIESPSGITATLMDQPGVPSSNFGCPEDNLLLSFDNEAVNDYEALDTTCNEGNLALEGTFKPFESLKVFNGEVATGVWKLKITDNADGDGGVLNGWDLGICSTIIPDLSIISSTAEPTFCINDNISFQILIGEDFDSTGINLSYSGNPVGSIVEFSANPVLPGEAVDVNIQGINSLGNYPITFTADDGNHATDSLIIIQIIGEPYEPVLSFPANGQTAVPLEPAISWLESIYSMEYLIKIAEDEAFTNIIASNLQTGLTYIPPMLNGNQMYFWQVTAKNICGEAYSQIFNFTTDMISDIKTRNGNDITIYPNPTNGKLYIQFAQPYQDKLKIELFSSSGQLVQLIIADEMNEAIELDLKEISNGIYWLRIVDNNSVLSRKVVLQK